MSRRDELLEVLADHVQNNGLESSVRDLADAADVAHNTLTHHFGSRTELMAAIFQRLSLRTATLPTTAPNGGSYEVRLTATWKTLTGPDYRGIWATFYEMLGTSLRDPAQHREFLRHVADDWTDQVTTELVEAGFAAKEAAAAATFLVGAVRGLVIDAISGGDPERISGAFELLLGFVAEATAPVD